MSAHSIGADVVSPKIPALQYVAMLKLGDAQAYQKLYDSYNSIILLTILRIVKIKIIAEDLTQDTFIKIFKTIHQYDRSRGSLHYWIVAIARNTAIDYLRSKYYLDSAKDVAWDLVQEEVEAKYQTHTNIDVIGIQRLFSVLTLQHQRILQLCFLQGFTHPEASKQLGIPLGTIKSRIRRSMQLLRNCFRENTYSSGKSL